MKDNKDYLQVNYIEQDNTIEIDTGYGYITILKDDLTNLIQKLKIIDQQIVKDKLEEWDYSKGL